jgi:hypothetical protein
MKMFSYTGKWYIMGIYHFLGAYGMFLRRNIPGNSYDKLADKIKRDLAERLQKKGIHIFKVSIDFKTDNINMSMCIKDQ